jgi:hypothetical protein
MLEKHGRRSPPREELDKPPLDAEDLKREIGDAETWDEASQDSSEDSASR